MKKLLIPLVFFMGSCIAEENNVLASPFVVDELVSECMIWAKKDSISKANLIDYVVACVNDELSSQGFQLIDELDLDELDVEAEGG